MKNTKFNALISSLLLVAFSLSAQNKYQLDVTKVQTEVKRGHLDLGGKNPAGEEISVNSFYLERNGKPFIPVIGEFHFSRYPHQYWDEELKKMKAVELRWWQPTFFGICTNSKKANSTGRAT